MYAFHVNGFDCFAGMRSYAEEAEGGRQLLKIQDCRMKNSQRLDEVTAMDEDGSIYAIGESDGTVEADVESAEEGKRKRQWDRDVFSAFHQPDGGEF